MTEGLSHSLSAGLPETSPDIWKHQHVLDVDDFSREEIDLVHEVADAMSEILGREVKKVPTLRGKTIVTMFFEASTRTRASFELAAKNLSADTVNLDAAKSSVTKGESFIDSLRTIQALGADVIIIRHSHSGAPYLASRSVQAHIINAGDGWHAHPSQSLLDTYTIRKHLGTLEGKKIVIVGDILHSRVAHSNLWGMSRLGAQIVLSGPQTLLPLDMDGFLAHSALSNVTVEPVLEKALKDADVVMALRLQLERQQAGLLPAVREYVQRYAITGERLRLAKPNALLLHPGPVNEGIELSPEVAYGAQSVIQEQVTNGVAIRMALLYLICGGKHK